MIKLMIAQDHRIFMEGIKCLLQTEDDIIIMSEVSGTDQMMTALGTLTIDVLILGLHMQSMQVLEAVREISVKYPGIYILALSMMDHPLYLRQMLSAGAKGYLVTSAGKEELLHAVRQTARGNSFISPAIVLKMQEEQTAYSDNPRSSLSSREIQVLELMAEGLTNKEIGEKIHISRRTVESHRQNLIIKTNSKNSFDLLKYGIYNGIIHM